MNALLAEILEAHGGLERWISTTESTSPAAYAKGAAPAGRRHGIFVRKCHSAFILH